jgi:hypothetical protein
VLEATEAEITSREMAGWGVDRIAAFKRDDPMGYAAVVRGETVTVSAPIPDPTESGQSSPEGSAGQDVTTPESPATEALSDEASTTEEAPQGADLINAVFRVIEEEGIEGFDELEMNVATARDLNAQEVRELGKLLREVGHEDLATALRQQATTPPEPKPNEAPKDETEVDQTSESEEPEVVAGEPTLDEWRTLRPVVDRVANPALPSSDRIAAWDSLSPIDKARSESWFGVGLFDMDPDADLSESVKAFVEEVIDTTGKEPDPERLLTAVDSGVSAVRSGKLLVSDVVFDRLTALQETVRSLPPSAPRRTRALHEAAYLVAQIRGAQEAAMIPPSTPDRILRSETYDARGRIVVTENGVQRTLSREETRAAQEASKQKSQGAESGVTDPDVQKALQFSGSFKLEQAYESLKGLNTQQTNEFWKHIRPEDREWFKRRAGDDLDARRTR